MKNVLDDEKVELLELQYRSAYKLYLESMRDDKSESTTRRENLVRYQTIKYTL